jgi:hypothetical protein
MRRCAIHHIVATEILAGALLIITPANAQMSRDWMVCTGKVQAAQPDQQVAACTAIIEAGQETPTNMAVAYCARGVAFDARSRPQSCDRLSRPLRESFRGRPARLPYAIAIGDDRDMRPRHKPLAVTTTRAINTKARKVTMK